MAWFCNHYRCQRCACEWQDEWSATCEDDCPECDYRHMTPFYSEDLTYVFWEEGGAFAVFHSPDPAEHYPDYLEIARFPTREQAEGVMRQFLTDRPREWGL